MKEKVNLVWVTANRSFVGGPDLGFTLLIDHCYQIPESNAKYFASVGDVVMGKIQRPRGKENPNRVVFKADEAASAQADKAAQKAIVKARELREVIQ